MDNVRQQEIEEDTIYHNLISDLTRAQCDLEASSQASSVVGFKVLDELKLIIDEYRLQVRELTCQLATIKLALGEAKGNIDTASDKVSAMELENNKIVTNTRESEPGWGE